jgi:hypothetical protein
MNSTASLREGLTEYLRTHRKLFSLAGLERAIGCPKQTLHHAVNNTQPLPDKWAIPLQETLHNLLMHEVIVPAKFKATFVFPDNITLQESMESFWNELTREGVVVLPTIKNDAHDPQ